MRLSGILFVITFILCGCGVENIFGTREQRVTWAACFVVLVISAFWLKRGE